MDVLQGGNRPLRPGRYKPRDPGFRDMTVTAATCARPALWAVRVDLSIIQKYGVTGIPRDSLCLVKQEWPLSVQRRAHAPQTTRRSCRPTVVAGGDAGRGASGGVDPRDRGHGGEQRHHLLPEQAERAGGGR